MISMDYRNAPAEKQVILCSHCRAEIKSGILRVGPVELDLDNKSLRVDGELRHCPLQMFNLLQLLMRRPGFVYSKERIFSEITGQDTQEKIVDVILHKARKAIKPYRLIRTHWGMGISISTEEPR